MKRLSIFSLTICSILFAEERAEPNISLVSEAFGHVIYENFECLNVKFDLKKIVQGIEDAAAGRESPLAKKDCIDAIYSEQEKNFKILSKENLQQAEEFLISNAKEKEVVSLERGKVQYRVISPGKGPKIKPHSSPLVRVSVKTIDGKDLWEPDLEEPLSLDETIEGLQVGLLGMKEGEKRILYIHPALSFKMKEYLFLFPNTLLMFEIEILKVTSCGCKTVLRSPQDSLRFYIL